jgi:hypothetical protein
MFTRAFLDGVLKIAQVIRYGKKHGVARIFNPQDSRVPERVLDEIAENVFVDREYNQKYQLTPSGLTPIA